MTRYLASKEVVEMLSVSVRTARAYMRKMVHVEKPLRVQEDVLEAWINSRTYMPIEDPGSVIRREQVSVPDRIPRR